MYLSVLYIKTLGKSIPTGIQMVYLGTKYIPSLLQCVTAVLPPTDDPGQLDLTNCWLLFLPLSPLHEASGT